MPPPIRLHHQDCIDGLRRIPSNSVRLVIADPPYAIGVKGAKWDAITDLSHYIAWARTWLAECARILVHGGALMFYGSCELNLVARVSIILEDELDMKLVQHLSWNYAQGGDARMSSMAQYAVRHELLSWFEKPGGDRVFRPAKVADHYTEADRAVALAKGVGRVTNESLDKGRPPKTWVEIPRENSRSKERTYGKHPSMKPLALCERLVRAHSNVGDEVVVPFAGSGSELVAAARLGRRAVGFELEPEYLELMKRRFTGHCLELEAATTRAKRALAESASEDEGCGGDG
jgi:site-specific DNA-methyltransferase (adenine-specific)